MEFLSRLIPFNLVIRGRCSTGEGWRGVGRVYRFQGFGVRGDSERERESFNEVYRCEHKKTS